MGKIYNRELGHGQFQLIFAIVTVAKNATRLSAGRVRGENDLEHVRFVFYHAGE